MYILFIYCNHNIYYTIQITDKMELNIHRRPLQCTVYTVQYTVQRIHSVYTVYNIYCIYHL